MIKLIIDSTCDLNVEFFKNHGVATLPLSVIIGDKAYLDGVDISIHEVHQYMKKGIVPKTSQVRLSDAYALFDKYIQQGDDFIYLAFDSQLSGTYASIVPIIEELKLKFPERKMAIVDSFGGSMASGLIALQMLAMIEENKAFKEIIAAAEEMVKDVQHRFLLTDLGWLAKSGRISRATAITGNIMGIKPVMHVHEGKIKILRIMRGSSKYLQHFANLIVESCKDFVNQNIAIAYCGSRTIADELASLLKVAFNESTFIITSVGSVLSSHLGLEGVGVFFFTRKPTYYNFEIAKNI